MVVVVSPVARSEFIRTAFCCAARAIAPADAVVGYANGAGAPGAYRMIEATQTSGV